MYTPAAFVEDDPDVIAAFLVEHPMAQLVTMTDDGLVATPLPMLYEPTADGPGSLVGHVARANRQWAETRLDGRGVGDLHRSERLHLAELVPGESRTRQGGADVELRDGACPRSVRRAR